MIRNKDLSYNGTIEFKSGVNPTNKSAELSYYINSNSDHIVPNSIYSELNDQISMASSFSKMDKIMILIAGIIVLNISILNSIESSRHQGMLRLLGCSKKKTIIIELLKALFIYGFACIIGFLISLVLSKVLISKFDFTGSLINSKEANLVLDIKLFLKVISPLFLMYMLTIIYSCKNILFKTSVEQQKGEYNYSSKCIKLFKMNKLDNKILINNLLSEKLFIVSNAIILAFSGYMYLINYYNLVPASVTNNELAFYDKVDLNMYRDSNILKNTKVFKNIEKLKSIDGIKGIYKINNEDGYEYINSNQLTSDYREQHMIKANKNESLRFNVLSYDEEGMKSFIRKNNFIEKNKKINEKNSIPEVLIYNKFYSISGRKSEDVVKGLKEGDLIELLLPYYYKNGDIELKKHKVKIAGFLSKEWYIYSNTEQSVPDIVFLDTTLNKLIGKNIIDNIYITLDTKKDINKISKEIKKKYIRDSNIKIKTEEEAFYDANKLVKSSKIRKITVSYILLLMSSINLIIGLIVSFIRNYSVYSTINSLGGNKNRVKRISIYEILALILPGTLIGILYCTYDSLKFFEFWKDRASLKGLNIEMVFTPPYINIGIYICFVGVSGLIGYLAIEKIKNKLI